MQEIKTIGVIGGGVVGTATAASYRGSYDVMVYDKIKERSTHNESDIYTFCDIIFICLPTPANPDGSCNTDALVQFFESLPNYVRTKNLVLRSTVPIGFTRRTAELMRCPNLVHSPEFLTARTATEDAANPRINVVGVPRMGIDENTVPLVRLYQQRFPRTHIHLVHSDESEAVKLAMNGFFAVKVAYWNEMFQLCQKKGICYDTVLKTILSEGRVHPLHTQVPGPDGKLGFGGECLPKDLASLVHQLDLANLASNVTRAADDRNFHDRRRTP